jgi:hypothetical protein
MEDIKNTATWGMGLLITGAVAKKALDMFPSKRVYLRKKKKRK